MPQKQRNDNFNHFSRSLFDWIHEDMLETVDDPMTFTGTVRESFNIL